MLTFENGFRATDYNRVTSVSRFNVNVIKSVTSTIYSFRIKICFYAKTKMHNKTNHLKKFYKKGDINITNENTLVIQLTGCEL